MAKVKTRAWLEELARRAGESDDLRREYEQNVREQQPPAAGSDGQAFAAADLNVSRTAAAMFLHPNTIRYRLERIAATTGHDPRTFTGLAELICILESFDLGSYVEPDRDAAR